MSAELSQTLIQLQKDGVSVADSGRSNAPMVAEAIHGRWGKLWEASLAETAESPPPDFLALQLGLAEIVKHDVGELFKIDDVYVHELTGDRRKREAREEASRTVVTKLLGIRSSVEGVYGKKASLDLFDGVTQMPADPRAIHLVGTRVRDQLRDPGFVFSGEKLEGWDDPDREKLAAALDRPLNRLGAALAGVSLERKESDKSLAEKTRTAESTRRTIRHAGGCLRFLYLLAGFDDLADKVLPRRRAPRRSGSADGDGEPTEPGVDDAPEDGTPVIGTSEDGTPEAGTPTDGERTGPIGIVS